MSTLKDRQKRKAKGLPINGSKTWDPQKRAAFFEVYYARPDIKARRAEQMRAYRTNPTLHAKNIARWALRRAVDKGLILKRPCRDCGASRVEAHHSDYSKPLEVIWLCQEHHIAEHAKAETEDQQARKPAWVKQAHER